MSLCRKKKKKKQAQGTLVLFVCRVFAKLQCKELRGGYTADSVLSESLNPYQFHHAGFSRDQPGAGAGGIPGGHLAQPLLTAGSAGSPAWAVRVQLGFEDLQGEEHPRLSGQPVAVFSNKVLPEF